MSKTITVYCGSETCGAVIDSRVVPDAMAEQQKALVPQVMNCPKAEENHPGFPASHTRVVVTEGPPAKKKAHFPAAKSAAPPPPPPPPLPEGASTGIVHMQGTEPDDRVFDSDEIPQSDIEDDLLIDPVGEPVESTET
jgi:hypothetical protein